MSSKPGRSAGRSSAGRRAASSCETPLFLSAGRWDPRRDRQGEGSPACCRYRASAHASADRRRRADTTHRQTVPVCRRAARGLPRLSNPAAPWRPVGARTASARIRWRARAMAGRFAPAASPVTAAPEHRPRRIPPSARSQKRAGVSFSCRENGEPAWRFRANVPRFQDLR